MAILTLRKLQLSYGDPPLIDGIDLSIEAGERICLLGRNGEGKSTLLRLISGDLKADDGDRVVSQGVRMARLTQEVPEQLHGSVFEVVADGAGETGELIKQYHAAVQALASTEKGHPDYSSARHRLAQIYLDDKQDYDAAIREFENVLSLPENQQLVYKQYAVAFTNLGHAYYEKGNGLVQRDKQAAAEYFAKAVKELQTAKQNTRFFPTQHYDEALHDTHYYMALAYHKLYLVTKRPAVMDSANLAWREYFDFFPQKLAGKEAFEQSRESARKYWDQIKEQ